MQPSSSLTINYTSFSSISISKIITLLILIINVHPQISISDTHISTTRNSLRTSVCNYYSGSYSSSDIATSKTYIQQYNYLTTQQIESILFNGNLVQLQTGTLLIVLPHLITFFIFSIIWIPLCCCCVWPERHPSCRKCRKPEKQMYGKCELKWSAYLSVILYLAIMAGAILGIIQGVNIINFWNDVGCKTAAVGDDILNGRLSPTVQNRFFVGISPLSSDLTSYNTNFNTIWTQNANSLNNAGNVATAQGAFQLYLQSIYTNYINPTYSNAFSTDGTAYTSVSSQFKDLFLGPTTVSSTILGKINNVTTVIFNQINAVLNPMIAAYTSLSANSQATVKTQITSTVTSISSFTNVVNNFINNWSSYFNNSSLFNQMTLVLQAFYGLFFGLAIFGLLGSIILACCSVVKVRLIMYFACAFLYILAFISFVLLIILAATAPNLSQVCSYIDVKLSTGAGTNYLFTKLGYSQIGNFMSNCMSDGTGGMMDKISPTFNTSFANLLVISQSAQLFNSLIPSYSTANLNAPFTAATNTISSVKNAQLLDVNDTISLTHITNVQTIGYSVGVTCNLLNVQGDSWMPSYSIYTCPGGKAQNSPCLNLGSILTCPLGCYEIMNQLQSASGDSSYATTLGNRYGSTCNYYTYINRLQDNWNVPRKASMNSVQTNLNTLAGLITTYNNAFQATQSNISTYSTLLQSNFNGLTNLTSGSFNGLDCRVIAESVNDMRNALCVGMLNSIYFNLICMILLSYGTLLAACCTVCAGVRHFRHLQKMQIHVGYKGVPISITDTKLFDK